MTFLRNAWYAAAWTEEVGPSMLCRTLLGEPVLLFRRRDGKAMAIGDTCPHRFAPLHKGRLIGDTVQCPYHGLTFDGTGACVRNPHGEGRIPKGAHVPAYPLAEKDTLLYIWMGDPAKADPAAIPEIPYINDTVTFARTRGQVLTMPLRWQLILDNLLDLSHAGFMHLGNLGSAAFSRGRMTVSQIGNRLQVDNLYPNGTPAPVFIGTGAAPPDRDVDYWVDVRWDPPGILSFDAGITDTGRPRPEGVLLNSAQLLTPESETSTHYFWRMFRNYNIHDTGLTDAIETMVNTAFHDEDEAMITDVQARMGGHDLMDLHPVMLSVDSGAVRARRILDELRRQESSATAPAAA